MRNLHKLFYKDYFNLSSEIELKKNGKNTKSIENISYKFLIDSSLAKNKTSEIQEINSKILKHTNSLLTSATLSEIPNEDKEQTFQLQTLYPGLITGVGIDHEAGIEGEFKLGMHFDYTYGMPIIYGSSVKGVLRNYFKDFYNGEIDKENLFNDIFEGKDEKGNKSIYDRDIFFDAVIVEANKKGKILDSDTLCPHGDNPLKNPTPISFLKIASGVTIEFRFKLVKSTINKQEISPEQKLSIFKEILTTVGIGAKTNVGYGQFE